MLRDIARSRASIRMYCISQTLESLSEKTTCTGAGDEQMVLVISYRVSGGYLSSPVRIGREADRQPHRNSYVPTSCPVAPSFADGLRR